MYIYNIYICMFVYIICIYIYIYIFVICIIYIYMYINRLLQTYQRNSKHIYSQFQLMLKPDQNPSPV